MRITNRTVTNTLTGETITFLETSAETGGVRVVAEITLYTGRLGHSSLSSCFGELRVS
jgi:hypothetical protein